MNRGRTGYYVSEVTTGHENTSPCDHVDTMTVRPMPRSAGPPRSTTRTVDRDRRAYDAPADQPDQKSRPVTESTSSAIQAQRGPESTGRRRSAARRHRTPVPSPARPHRRRCVCSRSEVTSRQGRTPPLVSVFVQPWKTANKGPSAPVSTLQSHLVTYTTFRCGDMISGTDGALLRRGRVQPVRACAVPVTDTRERIGECRSAPGIGRRRTSLQRPWPARRP